jgi:acetyltransferase-like isoleucine patch superfamily enzyme
MRQIGRHVCLSDDTRLGERVRIGNCVTVYPDVSIGDDCVILEGAVLGRPPLSAGNTTRPLPSARPLSIGPGSVIGANAVLYCGSSIGAQTLIGDLASLREGCTLGEQVVIGRGVMVMYDTAIGDRTRVIDGAILTGAMTVEADVFIGPGVQSINDNEVYLKRFGLVPFGVRGPMIRRFAVIGAGANLAAAVEVGWGAIVAPSAMVTRDVPPWTVVAGVPAQVIRPVAATDRSAILGHFGLEPQSEAG